jgi:hypothetical protein
MKLKPQKEKSLITRLYINFKVKFAILDKALKKEI